MTRRPRLLDLCCCAGGAGKGYADAGFLVVGVDIQPQPRYPFTFYQADALAFARSTGHLFDVIHASVPCQDYSPLGAVAKPAAAEWSYPRLIPEMRDLLNEIGKPWVMENVMAAPLDKSRSIVLCGSMFGLRTYRHRRFEYGGGVVLTAPEHPRHTVRTATKQRRQRWGEGWNVSITGDVGTYLGPEAMGIDWMNGHELCEAIPPAYTRHIGRQMIAHLATPEFSEAA